MKRKNLVSHSLSIWLSWILGVLAIVAGIAILMVALMAWEPVRSSMEAVSEGLDSANSAIELIGKDFGTSSSLFGEVSGSIRSTREVVHETWVSVNSITETIQEIRGVVLSVSDALENLPPTITGMIGRNYFSETLASLNSTFYSSGEMIAQMDHLSATLEPMEEILDEVAAGVDTLAGDLFDTEAAFGEATEHLDRAASAIRTAAGSSVLQIAIAATGLIPILVGIYLIIQAVALGRLYSSAGKASEGEAPDESMDYIDTDTSAE